jgi:hypothetical protein
MRLHPYVRIALGAALIVLSATVAFAPSAKHERLSTTTAVTAPTDATPSVKSSDDRSEAIKILRRG